MRVFDRNGHPIEVDEILPCPFCARIDLLGIEPQPEGGFLAVKCRACGTHGPSNRALTEVEAIARWNHRPLRHKS